MEAYFTLKNVDYCKRAILEIFLSQRTLLSFLVLK